MSHLDTCLRVGEEARARGKHVSLAITYDELARKTWAEHSKLGYPGFDVEVACQSIDKDVLSRAEVIDPAKLSGDRVKFGAKVVLLNIETDEEVTYQIVGPEESDLKELRISVSSPLARGLIGHQVGDEVTIKLPSGSRVYEIQEITFG